tara:strand:- start:4352 stop:4960 length:609 start_codon:yes stop_codon:yes gene_type:complete
MKAQSILNQIKEIVGVKLSEDTAVKLEEVKLDNGTIIVAEKFESGASVFIKSEEEEIALPIGKYSLEDGRELVVKEEGLIESIGEVKEEVEEKIKEEVEASAEETSEESTEETELEEEEMQYVTKEEFNKAIDEIKAMIDKSSKEEMQEETVAENKEELSAEPAEPLVHNPEAEEKQKFEFHISSKNVDTAMDRIYARINNN